ncbi:hypothetical protein D6D22_07751 [Aureobasidium pullulans]|nr:hypothetical protein D6D22_07751 [Aureobasidium pullulans]THW66333.1 hypothetical protein D6D25_01745 [Aureobasidium pullulans]THX26463.1 hypothetical protein D6D12_06208 [Aureobasidium pullulans]THX52304.1 hypothetical protein D6D11_04785 [Aureobasidium pullulans]
MLQQLCKHLRLAGLLIAAVAGFLAALLAVHQLVLPVVGWIFPSLESTFFDLAVYGGYPQRNYVSHNLTSPDLQQVRWDDKCDNGFIFISPQGKSVEHPGPMILDARGNLVWQTDQYGQAMNLKVQEYKGEKYLTFWAGHRGSSFGYGNYYMLDSSYQERYQVSAVGEGLQGDLHEFTITKDGSALITIYNVTQTDMTAMRRPADGWVNNNLFQEVDIETGKLLFQWNALDHFSIMDSFYTHPLAGYWESIPFDWFHINSVEKDDHGDYLISSRHLNSLIKVNGTTGDVVWTLGGTRNNFTDISSGEATSFSWQHDGRWLDQDQGTLTVFDNSDAGPLHLDASYSTARMIQINTTDYTAQLLHKYVSDRHTRAASQGSVQVLPSTNTVFVGWGHSPVFSEFDIDGTLICEAHYGAQYISHYGRVTSYRSLKADWVGAPVEPPRAKIQAGRLYASWSGATEVATWTLQSADSYTNAPFADVDVVDKIAFETSFVLPDTNSRTQYRVAASDDEGNILAYSEVATEDPTTAKSVWSVLLPLGGVFGVIAGFWAVRRFRKGERVLPKWRRRSNSYSHKYSRL